ncbi:MAG: hypothetical protein ABII71_00930 [Candidatus Micrarchaeota archaeon]
MLSPSKSVLALLFMFGLALASFDISDYLYDDETVDSVSYEDFTYLGNNYRIVSLAGEDIFLLRNGEIMADSAEVEDVIYEYYLDTYYPSDSEVAEMRRLLEDYNRSRNDGQKFIGREEYTCRGVLFIDGRVKYGTEPIVCRTEADDLLCQYAGKLMWQYLTSVTGVPPVASWEDLYEPIKEFGLSSHSADVIFETAFSKLDSAEDDRGRMYDALSYIHGAIPDLEEHIEVMETNMFGWTPEKSCDSTHWCMCPDLDLNDSILEDVEDKASDLMDKMGPFANYRGVSGELGNNTADRIAFAAGERSAGTYGEQFAALQVAGQNAIALGRRAVSHTTNPTLASKLDTLESLEATIPANIDSREFSAMASDLEDYARLTGEVQSLSASSLSVYNNTLEEKNNADTLLLVLETRELDPFSATELDKLKNDSFDLDAKFREGLTADEWGALADEYRNVSSRATTLLQDQEESPVYNAFLLFRGFARKMNVGIADFVTATDLATPAEVPDNKYLAFGGFSLLVLLSFGAIMLIAFLSVLVFKRLHLSRKRYVLMAAFVGGMGILVLFSGLLFTYMEKTCSDSSVEEYLVDFESRDSTALVIDMRSVTFNENPMIDCANSLASTFSSQNKSVTVYELRAGTCDKRVFGDTAYPMGIYSCMDEASGMGSMFVLNYSNVVEEPHFSTIYFNKAEISGNTAYYDSCPLTALFN